MTSIGGWVVTIVVLCAAGYLLLYLLAVILTGSSFSRSRKGGVYYVQLCEAYRKYAVDEFCTTQTYRRINEMLRTGELETCERAPSTKIIDFLEYLRATPEPKFKIFMDPPRLSKEKKILTSVRIYCYAGSRLVGLDNLLNCHNIVVDMYINRHDFKPIRDLIVKIDAVGADPTVREEDLAEAKTSGGKKRLFGR